MTKEMREARRRLQDAIIKFYVAKCEMIAAARVVETKIYRKDLPALLRRQAN